MADTRTRLGELKLPVVATAALAAVVVAALMGSSVYLMLGVLAAGLLAVWGLASQSRRAVRESEARANALAGEQAQLKSGVEALERETARLSRLLEALPMPLLATNEQGQVRLCNAAAGLLLGLEPGRIVGRSLEEVFTQEEILRLLAEARRGRASRGEVRVPRAGGARVWEVAAQRVEAQSLVVTLQDVTDESRAMQVRADFVANASHELRTPISAMRIALETLQSLGEDAEPAQRERFMGMVARNVERLEAMARDLLDLSKLESLEAAAKREPVAASSLQEELALQYESVVKERKLKLVFEFDPKLEEMQSDRNLLLLILGNLIDNATKFAFEGKQITVSGGPIGGGGVRLVVADQGIGIPLDQQQRIFERFYQVDAARSVGSPRRGTGLGLSIVKHALRRLNGTIRVESVWQQGTRMIVEIPGVLPAGG